MTNEEGIIENDLSITLVSEDEQHFTLPIGAAMQSVLLKDIITTDEEGFDHTEHISMTRISGRCLEKVVAFLKHHHKEPLVEIAHPLPADSFDQNVTQEWYQNFCHDDNMDRSMLFELLRAANFLDINALLDLACLKVTFMLQGKNEEEIRDILNLPEMSPEEEGQARAAHPWIFENN